MSTPHHFNTVSIIGSGIMGSGIAQVVAASTGATVHLCDLDRARLDGALDRIENGRFGLRRSAERGRISPGTWRRSWLGSRRIPTLPPHARRRTS